MAGRKQGVSKEAKAILEAVIDSTSIVELTAAQSQLETFLAPLVEVKDALLSKDSVTSLSSRYGGVLIELLKHTNLSLSRPLESNSLRAYSALTRIALNCLHIIRPALKGRFFEVEVQRYAFLRTLFAHRCYDESIQEAELIFKSILTSWDLPPHPTIKAGESLSTLPLPAKGQNSESVALTVGVGIHLVLCLLERTGPSECWLRLKSVMGSLAPWFRCAMTTS
jgi:hypothetical protein